MRNGKKESFITEKYLVCLTQELSDLMAEYMATKTLDKCPSKAEVYRELLKIGLMKVLGK